LIAAQINFLEINAFGLQKALFVKFYANHSDGRHFVTFDNIVGMEKS
jgi:hypothetical protein